MCPLCILTAIVLGGGGSVACGIQWVKGKLGSNTDADGCQTLRLNDEPKDESLHAHEQPAASDQPVLMTPAR